MISHVACFLAGLLTGAVIICLLAGPRIAELESTVTGLRTLLKPDEALLRNVRSMDREVEG